MSTPASPPPELSFYLPEDTSIPDDFGFKDRRAIDTVLSTEYYAHIPLLLQSEASLVGGDPKRPLGTFAVKAFAMHEILVRKGFATKTLTVPTEGQSEYTFLQYCIDALRPLPTTVLGVPFPRISLKLDNAGLDIAAGIIVTAKDDTSIEFPWLVIPKMYKTEFIRSGAPDKAVLNFGKSLLLALTLSRMKDIDTQNP